MKLGKQQRKVIGILLRVFIMLPLMWITLFLMSWVYVGNPKRFSNILGKLADRLRHQYLGFKKA